MKRKRSTPRTFDLGLMHKFVYKALAHDLAFDTLSKSNASRRIDDCRSEWTYPLERVMCDPYLSKCMIQLRDYHKRLITDRDNVEALEQEGLQQFPINQNNFHFPQPQPIHYQKVIEEARRVVHGVLNYFDFEEFGALCSFGKRAAVGLPRLQSYLDNRGKVLNGTTEQIAWFNAIRARDVTLTRATRKNLKKILPVTELKITCVPKSFKSVRTIAPDTVLGGFLSRGLGALIRKRLEGNTHIDLAIQQTRHRRWAQKASRDGSLSTIDMSKASDSFVWQHIEALMPIDWLGVLKVVRTEHYNIDDTIHELNSYMLMGSGHTFPLQTLLFYALAEGVRLVSNQSGKVSVYGDDIIIPTKIANSFINVMENFGFTINTEKSFYDAPDLDRPHKTFFRESCGGDFISGIDVRPYAPESTCGFVHRFAYFAEIHKLINGFLLRWSEYEIPTVLHFLLGQLQFYNKRIMVVPDGETDTAGVPGSLSLLVFYSCQYPTLHNGIIQYEALRVKTRKRRIGDEYLYYWYSLRSQKGGSEEWDQVSELSLVDKKGREIRKEREVEFRIRSNEKQDGPKMRLTRFNTGLRTEKVFPLWGVPTLEKGYHK